ncbi:MAG TPA: hypothetical protein VFB32_06755 [Rudaea sp.]|nr:hypothetical protein [Rudaea sp.]
MATPSLLVLVAILVVLAVVSIRRIPEGHAYTLRRIGGHMRTVGSGTHIVLPLVERVSHKINLLGNVVEVPVERTAGSVLQGKIYFQVMDAERADAVIDRVAELVRERIPELVEGQAEADVTACCQALKSGLNHDFRERGLLVTRVQLSPEA